jgi:hypothetical protein
MRIGALRTLLASTGALLVLSALPCAAALAAEGAVSPLPASDYTVRPVCSEPAPGHAGCLALKLVAKTAAAQAHTHPLGMTRSAPIGTGKAAAEVVCNPPTAEEGCYGLRPQDLHSIYQLPSITPAAQTIAIVDAYNDPGAEADLNLYSKEFGLPELTGCTAGEVSNCFEKVNQKGDKTPLPSSTGEEADSWAVEISLDIEVSHAVCQTCRIVLVEGASSSFADLEESEETAASLGATEISNSWGGPECTKRAPRRTECDEDSPAFDHQGIAITAATGDDGYLDWDAEANTSKGYANYPASSPHVVAVGGTRLDPLSPEGTWAGETVWNGKGAGGSGCSISFAAPEWQSAEPDWSSLGCGSGRATADVSADADPYTGMAIYDSTPESPENSEEPGWTTVGGTSLAAPLIAATFALAGGASGVEYPAQTLYENELADPTSLHDVTEGSNGECATPFDEETGFSSCTEFQEAAGCAEKPAICWARVGYDGPTGIGTPDGIAAFQPPTKQKEKSTESGSKGIEGKGGAGSGGGSEEVGGGGAGSGAGTSTSGSGSGSGAGTGIGAGGRGTGTGAVGGGQEGSSSASTDSIIELSDLVLTPSALIALNHPRAKVSEVGFAFTLSATARVRATLTKLVRLRGRYRWEPLPGALSFAAAKGHNHRRLTNHGPLAPGRYRLTLTPQHGVARSVGFRVG